MPVGDTLIVRWRHERVRTGVPHVDETGQTTTGVGPTKTRRPRRPGTGGQTGSELGDLLEERGMSLFLSVGQCVFVINVTLVNRRLLFTIILLFNED